MGRPQDVAVKPSQVHTTWLLVLSRRVAVQSAHLWELLEGLGGLGGLRDGRCGHGMRGHGNFCVHADADDPFGDMGHCS